MYLTRLDRCESPGNCQIGWCRAHGGRMQHVVRLCECSTTHRRQPAKEVRSSKSHFHSPVAYFGYKSGKQPLDLWHGLPKTNPSPYPKGTVILHYEMP